MTAADWNPEQYRKFAAERAQPFHDLLGLVQPAVFRRAVDLGCGPGELTAAAAATLRTSEMVGIDNSPTMITAAAAHADDAVRFVDGDISRWTSAGDVDLVLANASLQWIPNHAAVLAEWSAGLAPGGQLAVQVPANAHMPSHRVADALAHTPRYLDAFDGDPPADPVAENVFEPEVYSQLLFDLGFESQHVRLQVYPHVLPSSRAVVQWVRGTMLTRFQKRLPADIFEEFVTDYEVALLAEVGDRAPFFFPFRRILMWGRRPS
ncbi:MAG TPA: methyltransferase domain-containing protein [Ilumatobacteraceae bacterium]|nr:methyltransferase domain-containing protein [Ilumatobacteraceae bacterium]HRB05063.1 methyltransferase domain-containing protein [Ilumatobacteraceae bacterium]